MAVPGAWLIVLEPKEDDRGSFTRTFCVEEFTAHGIDARIAQTSISRNVHPSTLRGLHLQHEPHAEGKLIRCTSGAAFDVLVDLRPTSPTYCSWVSIDLAGDSDLQVYAPPGVAHGFLTLEPQTTISYQMTVPYVEGSGSGVRWDDPVLGIEWPTTPEVISERDASYPDFQP